MIQSPQTSRSLNIVEFIIAIRWIINSYICDDIFNHITWNTFTDIIDSLNLTYECIYNTQSLTITPTSPHIHIYRYMPEPFIP
uniref:Uncharacterized protein n=1 Tax=viral metagenome TaxID=1070528 RepID=A0A6C0BLE9_9ZZZZ